MDRVKPPQRITGPPRVPGRGETEKLFTKGEVLRARVVDQPSPGRVRLQVGPRLIQALLSQEVQAGREVKLLVAQTWPRVVLHLVGEEGGQRPARAEPEPAPEKGALFRARVVEAPAEGRVRLKVGSRLIQAQTTQALRPGQEVTVRVAETLPRLVWRVEGAPGPAPLVQALGEFLEEPAELARAAAELKEMAPAEAKVPPGIESRLRALLELVGRLSPEAGRAEEGFLGRLVSSLGLGGEASEIKTSVARLFTELLGWAELETLKADLDRPGQLLEALAHLSEAADRLEALNYHLWTQDQTLHLVFPLFWPGAEGRGELVLKWPPSEGAPKEEGAFQVTFLLSLSRLGRVKIELQLQEAQLRGIFWAETPGARAAIEQSLDRLAQALEARGISAADLTARTFPPAEEPPVSLALDWRPAAEGLIDLKV